MVMMFLGIATLWIIIGVLVFLVLMILNAGSDVTSSSSQEETPVKEESFISFTIRALVVFIQWPMVLALVIRALKNRKAPLEQSEAEVKALGDQKKEIEARFLSTSFLIIQGKMPLAVKWTKKSGCYCRNTVFLTEFGVTPLISHYVKVKKWRVVECYRGVPNSHYQKFIGAAKSVKKAQERCEEDKEWLDACTLYNVRYSDPKLVMFLEEMRNEN